jgi:hypothetical protein
MVVADAAAVVASEGFLDLVLRGRRVLIKKCFGAHYYAWRAIAALERGIIDEGLLDRMKLTRGWILESLNSSYALAIAFDRKSHTGENRFAVHYDSAEAARTVVAGYFRSGVTELLSQRVRKGVSRVDVEIGPDAKVMGLAVDGKGNRWDGYRRLGRIH